MRIAILVWSRIWGGLESHVVDLAATAIQDGHYAVLACVGEETAGLFRTRGAPAPVQVLNPPTGIAGALDWYAQFRALGVDACVFEKGTLHTGSVVMDLAARAAFKVFVTLQQLEPPVLGSRTTTRHIGGLVPGLGVWWYRQRFRGWLRSLAPERTICITETVRSGLETGYGFSARRLPVIYNGVDIERFSPDPARTTGAGIPDVLTFGTTARLVHEKGIDVAIRAFGAVIHDAPSVPMRLLIANDGAERPSLEALVRRLGIDDHVRFLGFQQDLPALYRTIDFFLVPSRIEAQGLVVLEALASGCPVIASAVGGIPEMITRPELGTLVPPDDPEALADAINAARLLSADQRRAQSAAGRAHVSAHFVARTQCRKILTLIEQLGADA
jgi:glycosyltransferase involved in cell wall biosynthesis